jgi:hypothetical protein
MTIEKFAEAVAQVMRSEGVSLETLQTKAPLGFWKAVARVTGQSADAPRCYWAKHRHRLCKMLTQTMVE